MTPALKGTDACCYPLRDHDDHGKRPVAVPRQEVHSGDPTACDKDMCVVCVGGDQTGLGSQARATSWPIRNKARV